MEVDKHKIWLGIGVSVVVIGVLVLLMYNSGGVKAGKAIASVVPLTLGVGEMGIDPASATLNTGDNFWVTVKANLGENKKATKVNFWVFYDPVKLKNVEMGFPLINEKEWLSDNLKWNGEYGNYTFNHFVDPASSYELKLTGTVDLLKIKFEVKSTTLNSTVISLGEAEVLESSVNLITAEPKSAVFTLLGVCVPQCSGKSCGDDGCGGSCGTCPAGQTCDDTDKAQLGAQWGCVATACVPQCSGKACGDDGCGGSCGSCGGGVACQAGVCVKEETKLVTIPLNQKTPLALGSKQYTINYAYYDKVSIFGPAGASPWAEVQIQDQTITNLEWMESNQWNSITLTKIKYDFQQNTVSFNLKWQTDLGGFWSEANAIDLTDGTMKEVLFAWGSTVHPLHLGDKTFGLKMGMEEEWGLDTGDPETGTPILSMYKNIFIYDQSSLLYSSVVSSGWHLLMDVGGEKLYVDMGNDESKLSLRWVKPDVVEDCTNGIDEDLDDEIDCADSECKGEINSEGKVCTHSVTMAGMTYTGWCSSNSCVSSDKSCYDDGALALVGSKNLVCNNHNWVTCVQSTLGPSPSGKFNCVKEGTKFVWKAADGEAACISNCAGKTCGDDGCGGSCGACVTPATEIPATELNCGDGTDNDDDTLIDCSDINDCAEGTSCGMGKACSNAFCTFKVEEGNYDAKEVVNEGDVAAIKLNPAGFWNYVGNNVQKLNQYLKKMSDNWKK